MHFRINSVFGAFLCCVVVLIFCVGSFFIRATDATSVQTQIPKSLIGATNFELGQYYFNHGNAADGTYNIDTAKDYFQKAIQEDDRQNDLLWYQSGRIDFIQGDFDAALYKFQKQIEYFGDTVPNVYYMIGLTYGYKAKHTGSIEDWQKAEEGFIKSLTFFETAPWPYVDLSWVYFSQGKFVEMKPLLEEGMSHDSDNPWLLNMYGLVLLHENDKELAHAYFLLAQEYAETVTTEQWGQSYPGNDPELWDEGLAEFKSLIAKNVALTE